MSIRRVKDDQAPVRESVPEKITRIREDLGHESSSLRLLLKRSQVPILRALWALAIAGLLERVVVALISEGSNDVGIWKGWATLLEQRSLTDMYSSVEGFNHPPLMAAWSLAALRLARGTGVRFAILLKVPSLLADGLASYLLWRIWRSAGSLRAAAVVAAFAWNLDSILVSGFHGNTDSFCAMLCLVSAACLQRRAFFVAGLGLAAALNVKLIPIVLVPSLLLQIRTRRQALALLGGLALGLVPFLPFLVSAGEGFYRHAIVYNSLPDNWGIGFFLNSSEQNARFAAAATRFAPIYRASARYLILLACTMLGAWGRWRRWSPYRIYFLCLATFLVFTPGFGVQYTVYVVPLLFAINLGRAVAYSFASGLFILSVYFVFGLHTFPWRSEFNMNFPLPTSLFGLVAWMVLITIVLSELAGEARGRPLQEVTRAGEG